MKKRPAKKAAANPTDSRATFQLRLNPEVHEKLKNEAKTANISMNQLIQGVCQWAADNIRQGRPVKDAGVLIEKRATECVWFGYPQESEIEDIDERKSTAFHFIMDFSGRNAVSGECPIANATDD